VVQRNRKRKTITLTPLENFAGNSSGVALPISFTEDAPLTRGGASMTSQEISNWTAATLDQRSSKVIGQTKMASRTFWRAACVGLEVVLVVITISS